MRHGYFGLLTGAIPLFRISSLTKACLPVVPISMALPSRATSGGYRLILRVRSYAADKRLFRLFDNSYEQHDEDGVAENNEIRPSGMVGCARTASRSAV